MSYPILKRRRDRRRYINWPTGAEAWLLTLLGVLCGALAVVHLTGGGGS